MIFSKLQPSFRKNNIYQIAQKAGHSVLFLPTYSPDLNRIEQDFATRS